MTQQFKTGLTTNSPKSKNRQKQKTLIFFWGDETGIRNVALGREEKRQEREDTIIHVFHTGVNECEKCQKLDGIRISPEDWADEERMKKKGFWKLETMVKCLRNHWEGILGFWRYDGLTNAGMEGFNNKVRTMIRQAYGFRDEEYMRLKIFDLPNKRINDGI